MNFVKFTEHNENEGEDWNFWLQLDGNESDLKQLESWLGTFDDYGDSYELDLTPVTEEEVDILVKHTNQGYMDYENKVTGIFKCPHPSDEIANDADKGYEWLNDNFYKGGIEGCFQS